MKQLLLIISLLLFSLQISAQVLYPTQPKEGYYEDLKAFIMPLVPSESELIIAKASSIPVNFKDTLLKYDWYEIASYYIYEKTYHTYFGPDLPEREAKYGNNEFSFNRYTPEGITYEMKLDRHKDASIRVTTTTFDENTAVKLIDVKKIGKINMRITSIYGETENQEIVSYKNGIMIMKLRQFPNSTTKVFINAYLAVPKAF